MFVYFILKFKLINKIQHNGKDKIKSEFHKLIDSIEDEKLLENFYDVISAYGNQNKDTDIIDELTEKQKARLMNSIEQVSESDTINNEIMNEQIRKWLTE
ncbi:MAG: hypothetical protein IPH77_05645 [Ignavibacteria bacterium]|nr:hypothetical protein [Ignavibacteria bacterium]